MSQDTSSAFERSIDPISTGVQSWNTVFCLAMSFFEMNCPGQSSFCPGARTPDSKAAVAVIGLNVDPAGYVPWNALS